MEKGTFTVTLADGTQLTGLELKSDFLAIDIPV